MPETVGCGWCADEAEEDGLEHMLLRCNAWSVPREKWLGASMRLWQGVSLSNEEQVVRLLCEGRDAAGEGCMIHFLQDYSKVRQARLRLLKSKR